MEKFKTIHENNVQINPFSIENQVKAQMESIRYKLKNLPKYECNTNSGGQDCWCTMDEDREGEYIKLEDALKLFIAENDI